MKRIFIDYLGDERLLPEPDHLTLAEFVRYVPRYEPAAQAEEYRRDGKQAAHIWEGGVGPRIVAAYLKDLIRDGASRSQIQKKIKDMRHTRHHLHVPFTMYPEYAELRQHLKEEPWYFFRQVPEVHAPPASRGGTPTAH